MGYSSSIYRAAKYEMDKRRGRAFEKQEKNKKIFYSKCPRAEIIEREIASTSIKAAKEIFSGKSNVKKELEKLKENNLNLQKELTELLVSKGFPENYLDEQYTCADCKDTGYIDGKMCSCMKLLLRDIAYNELNKKSPLSLCDFSAFDTSLYSAEVSQGQKMSPRDKMSKIFNYCKNYAENFSDNSPNLLLRGGTGLGKTHLSLSIAKEVINRGYGVIYFSLPNLMGQLEKERFNSSNEEEKIEEILTACDLLILDDMGTEFSTSYTTSAIYNVINTRIITSKPTVINTNLSLGELENWYSKRFVSRLLGDFIKLEFIGKDIRQIKNRNRGVYYEK